MNLEIKYTIAIPKHISKEDAQEWAAHELMQTTEIRANNPLVEADEKVDLHPLNITDWNITD